MRGKKPKFWGAIVRTWAQIPGLGFGPVRVHWMDRGGTSSYPIWNLIIKKQMEGVSKRNYSSDIIHAAQVFIPATRVILQEAPLMETCPLNIWEGRKPKNIYGNATTTTLNAQQLLLWSHLCGEDLWTVLPWLPQLTKNQRRCLMGQVLKWRLRWSTSVG